MMRVILNLNKKRICLNRLYCQKAINLNTSAGIIEENNGHYLKRKINELVLWYEELTGMDEVRAMQNKVIEAQTHFANAQEKRREASKVLNQLQNKLKEISTELDTTARGETRHLRLITKEHEILKEERRLNTEFALLEREERESFTLLTSYVKESHQKERSQAERTKYWSIIGSVVGTVIGVAGSSINNEFKMKELRKLVRDTTLRTSMLPSEALIKHEKELNTLLSDLKVIIGEYGSKNEQYIIGNLDKIMHNVSNEKELMVSKKVEHLQERIEELKSMLKSVQNYDGQLIALPPDIEDLINKQRTETRILVAGVTMLGVIALFVASRMA